MRQLPRTVLAVCMSAAPFVSAATAEAKQQCSAAAPADQHGYWSWRLIDGRKCWYEGRPMLAKSLLEWPAQAEADARAAGAVTDKPRDPLDAQALAPAADTFEALWRGRIEQH
jgi:hypothetical protein